MNEAAKAKGDDADDELVVFSIVRDSECSECKEPLFKGSLLRMENQKPLCLDCADLGHLEFLGRGDAALTRRSRKYSALSAVVVRFSRSRGRYERQGVLVEPGAIDRAEQECAADAGKRLAARARSALARDKADQEYIATFAAKVRELYPRCPQDSATQIAEHACERYSGRVGRSASAKAFEESAVVAAVRAHLRHRATDYDKLLSRGVPRDEARRRISLRLAEAEAEWRPANQAAIA